MQTVWWIAVQGGSLLFIAMAGVIGLMYLLTAPILVGRRARATAPAVGDPGPDATASEESERRRRAAALAVAVACAEIDHASVFAAEDSNSWRLLHRSLRMRQHVIRRVTAR